jgi:hypothetical protein
MAADAGDEGQTIVGAPPCVAASLPVADVAVLDRLGVVRLLHESAVTAGELDEAAPRQAAVGGILGEAVAVDPMMRRFVRRCDDVERLRQLPLRRGQQVGV